eukprot:TRINITY_DN39779_c0_g2_i1.p1 TRINITY_DN39779_c0_g2~~TRINITY_DN39779_c0_g2_i1.p1  ORF type:complete len:503 (+),score=129.20 TRINITY_DN39779_c0_g2_i1:96-1604(+)
MVRASGAIFAASLSLACTTGHAAAPADLKRAKQKVPRAAWKADGFAGMSRVLTKHLEKIAHSVTPCAEWSLEELQQLQLRLREATNGDLAAIYEMTDDRRRHRFGSSEELREHWAALADAVAGAGHAGEEAALRSVRRDGLCHEVVMSWAHHLTETARDELRAAELVLPSLPEQQHVRPAAASSAAHKVHDEYAAQVSCQQCHTGTIHDPHWANATLPQPLPLDKEQPGRERQYACTYLNDPPCGPCEGLGGLRHSDGSEDLEPLHCEVIHGPEKPAATHGHYPALGTATITGDTRLPIEVIPTVPGKFQPISANLSLGWKDGFMRMRYDFAGMGAEVNVQSAEQAKGMDVGAQLSISHEKCICDASIAGNMHVQSFDAKDPLDPLKLPASQGGAAYLGRVRVKLDGATEHSQRTVLADHYMKWAFHFLVDADENSNSFGLPLRLYGSTGVRQIFDNWVLEDPEKARPDVWKMPAGCVVKAPGCSVFQRQDAVAVAGGSLVV